VARPVLLCCDRRHRSGRRHDCRGRAECASGVIAHCSV